MFEAYQKKVEALEKVPLRIECELADSAVDTNGLHFDAILSYAVVEEQTQGKMFQSNDYIYIPLPLQDLWRNPRRVPLWASTDLTPIDNAPRAVRYWHKRGMETGMTTKNIRTTQGTFKEKRVPMSTTNTRKLSADVIGNAAEIARLLQNVSSVGKKRNSAGAVRQWRVYEIKEFTIADAENKVRRPVPIGYLMNTIGSVPIVDLSHIAFSPPYWHPSTRDMCVVAGSDL